MSGFEQVGFGSDDDFTRNPEPRCPCLLLLDTSHSMQGRAISELNRGIVTLKDQLASDALAMKRVEIAVVTFGPVNIDSSFQTPDFWQPTTLSTTGDTPMGAAIEQGIDLLRERKQRYKDNGSLGYSSSVRYHAHRIKSSCARYAWLLRRGSGSVNRSLDPTER